MEEKKCEQCGTKIWFFNKSWNSKLCSKCFSKPVYDVFKWIFKMIFIIILAIIFINFNGNSKNSIEITDNVKLAPLDAEVAQLGTSLTTYKVINRNDYVWHNIKITVNDYYSCWERETLEPEDFIYVEALICNQFAVQNQRVESVEITADEGSAKYS